MNEVFECELEYFSNPHLMQLYTGFFNLEKKRLIKLHIKKSQGNFKERIPMVSATINKKYKVTYDVLDGLTWIPGDVDTNLKYFTENIKADFFFKRSFHPSLLECNPSCKVFPLGLNYNVQPDTNLFNLIEGYRNKVTYFSKSNFLLKKIFKKRFYYTEDFEYPPFRGSSDKILFLTRLWNPDEAKSERSWHFRKLINEMRVECIETCKRHYGKNFTGGLQEDDFSRKNYAALIAPSHLTKKGNYLKAVKEHSICIATTGLHKSIGWKLAEYVAASRAIVTEPLHFTLPGKFENRNNYLEFETPEQLIKNIDLLLDNKELMVQIMKNNFCYYNNYVKPENMILNTLITIHNEVNGVRFSPLEAQKLENKNVIV